MADQPLLLQCGKHLLHMVRRDFLLELAGDIAVEVRADGDVVRAVGRIHLGRFRRDDRVDASDLVAHLPGALEEHLRLRIRHKEDLVERRI